MAAKKRSTADFYKSNQEAYKKKLEYDKKRNAKPSRKKYRAELAKERRARGIMGKGGPDVSHAKGGKFKTNEWQLLLEKYYRKVEVIGHATDHNPAQPKPIFWCQK